MKHDKFLQLLFKSKQYQFDGSVLEITDYYTGESVKLDLSLLPEDVFEEMVAEDEEWE